MRPVERQFLAVHGKEVLAVELAELGEEIAEPPDNRVIAADRVARLAPVDDEEDDAGQQKRARSADKERREELQPRVDDILVPHVAASAWPVEGAYETFVARGSQESPRKNERKASVQYTCPPGA